MGRLKSEKTSASSSAQTAPMLAAPPRRPIARVRLIVLVVVLVVDALVALPLGWMSAKYHVANDLVSLFSSSGQEFQSTAPWLARAPSPTLDLPPARSPSPSPLPAEVWEDTFQRPDQLFWGMATGGGSWMADASTNPAFSIADQTGLVSAASGAYTALLGPRLANAELLVTFSISQFNGENNMGEVLEYAGATRWYKLYLDGESLVLIKRDAAHTFQLGSFPFPARPGLRYNLLAQVRGAVFLAKVWPADSPVPANWELRVADPSATWSSGYSGVRMYFASRDTITSTVDFFREERIP